MTSRRAAALAALLALSLSPVWARQGPPAQAPASADQGGRAQGRGQRQPARDRTALPKGTATIAGRVLGADNGRPIKRARVMVTGAAAAGGRGGGTAITDDQGRYVVAELAAGTYSITASKSGFVDAAYGQRRPLQPGQPLQVADGQSAANVDLRLTRGGVITGRIVDEDGEALARALVTVQRYQYVRGERQLTPAGGDQTDDRGQYRVFGLPPGEYFVSASANGLNELIGRGLQQLAAGLGAQAAGGRGGRGGALGAFGLTEEPEATGYAPTYYPGVVNAPEAGKVPVGPGQEVGGIDFQIQLVPFATVSGIVAGAADDVGTVIIAPQDGAGGPLARLGGQVLTGRVQADGTFRVSNVPPGRYVAIARSGGRGGEARTAVQPIVVNGQHLDGVTLTLQPGVTISGNITVESSGTPAPEDYSTFRIDAPDVSPLPFGGGGRGGGPFAGPVGAGGRAEKNGSFQIANLLPGAHYIRVAGGGQGQAQWAVKSITVGGQDVSDSTVELKPGQNLDNVTVVLTDRTTEISGTVRDARRAGSAGINVIAFSTEQAYWRPQSRRIQAVRSDGSGAYRIRNLPPGDYFLLATDDVEQGEWFDPAFLESVRGAAERVTINEGDRKTQDLRGPG
ncbi:MAG TPA: carboxypeptidase-like regulatory domain-containing protein [Vicinamibacterales bacterium]|nr:carboxypeptidase-like regulatory domain-containing protein [Vicinamibacterales bacterium]